MKISKNNAIFAMDPSHSPVAYAKSGDKVTFETMDCFSDTVQSHSDLVSSIDFNRVNPATGPLFIEDAKAGDVLKVTIEAIRVNNQGAVVTAPGLGLLSDGIETEETIICPVSEDTITFKDYNLPIRKMVGVIGTAPKKDAINTGTPDSHGGNMDSVDLGEGATVYLPVNVDGALLALGDLHAAMGDGEVMGSGLEIAGEVDLTVEVIKNKAYPTPMIETETEWMTVASAETLDESALIATQHMSDFLQSKEGMTFNEAGMFMSIMGSLKVSQAVNPNKTMRMVVQKAHLKSK